MLNFESKCKSALCGARCCWHASTSLCAFLDISCFSWMTLGQLRVVWRHLSEVLIVVVFVFISKRRSVNAPSSTEEMVLHYHILSCVRFIPINGNSQNFTTLLGPSITVKTEVQLHWEKKNIVLVQCITVAPIIILPYSFSGWTSDENINIIIGTTLILVYRILPKSTSWRYNNLDPQWSIFENWISENHFFFVLRIKVEERFWGRFNVPKKEQQG